MIIKAAAIHLLLLNLYTYFAFGYDKWLARKNKRRTPESRLLLLCLIGGTPGGLIAMRVFRHKNRKRSFRIRVFSIVALQIALLITIWRLKM